MRTVRKGASSRKRKAEKARVATFATFKDFDKTVIVRRIDPVTGEETLTTTMAVWPRPRKRGS